ncbi:DUF5694 domain-containing protein [Ferruginibacter yonginensis]|uniref:DUF5694 domain-containing protein n=1 Tax=Ferruginibacter yonginensis TaxID=1310416 RepID=A0ABV8QS19_9BACT
MKLNSILFISIFLVNTAFGQTNNEKIKVILLGTFHYGATSDRSKTSFPDLFSKKRQSELDNIAQRLVKFGVNKFFLETPVSKQKKQDSLYASYIAKTLTDTIILRDEEIQIAFRTAAINNALLIAADSRQELPYDMINEYEQKHKNDTINPYSFFEVKYPFTQKQKKLSESTLSEYYIQLNNGYNRQSHMFDYIHYALSYGVDKDYIGEAFALSWYDRNLKIFTNILRNIDIKKDKVIVVLFGSSHTALIRHFFEDHPYFEIIELNQIF